MDAINYKNGKIYKVVNDVDDMIYIGSTATTLSKRFSAHRKAARTQTYPLYQAMATIGEDHFQIILIQDFACASKRELEAKEYELIQAHPREKLYNKQMVPGELFVNNNPMKGKTGAEHACFKRGMHHRVQSQTRVEATGWLRIHLHEGWKAGAQVLLIREANTGRGARSSPGGTE